MNWDQLEAVVRVQNAEPLPEKEWAMGDAVAWISRSNGRADYVTEVHRVYQGGRTFCRLAVPPAQQHLPVLPSLRECGRCKAMSRRALHYAKIAATDINLRASA